MNNPVDRWNPGWNFVMNPHHRAAAGGNRALQPIPAAGVPVPVAQPAQAAGQPAGRRPAAAPAVVQNNRRHNNNNNNNNNNRHNQVRRDHRHHDRLLLNRDDQERIEAAERKRFQMRTAVEFDPRESICWERIENQIIETTHNFPGDGDCEDIFIPDDAEIATMLRSEMQTATIKETRELLMNFGATEDDLRSALQSLEIHLTTNACEYNEIESVAGDLIRNVDRLTTEIDELDEIMCRIEKIRMC